MYVHVQVQHIISTFCVSLVTFVKFNCFSQGIIVKENHKHTSSIRT